MVSRREVLAFGGFVTLLSLSGCTDALSDPERLSLTLLNFDSEPHTLVVELLRMDAGERSDAAVLRERYELGTPPEDDAAYAHEERNILESEKFFVSVHLQNAPATRGTYPYYPDCEGRDGISDKLYIEVRTDPEGSERYIDFKQTACSGDSGWF